jgi:TonB family protein
MMRQGFIIEDGGRFGRIMLLAILLHLILLSGLHIIPQHTPKAFQRKIASMLEVVTSNAANERTPRIALNIGPLAHTSVVLHQSDHHSTSSIDEISFAENNKKDINENLHVTQNKQSPYSSQLKRKVISAASFESRDAKYLSNWQNYVEKYGNDHYPKSILNSNLQGNLRLLVAINRDGSLQEVTIRQSSGSPILDQAAVDIVLNAAPFAPLPPEMADEIDVLEIIRTWQFRGKLSTSIQ